MRVYVPVMNRYVEEMGREKILAELRRLDAERVFLALPSYPLSEEQKKKEIEMLTENAAYFHAAGLEVGAWLWTFTYTGNKEYQPMVSPLGKETADFVCPSDKAYRAMVGSFLAGIARSGVDMIMFDDDFRYGFFPQGFGVGCVCPAHRAVMEEELGESLDGVDLAKTLLSGAPNRYRSAWLRANGKVIEDFAREMRAWVDKENPDVRLGQCSCMTAWDFDGTHPDRISRILAGKNKPFHRQIGAPYWANHESWGNSLRDVIELERMERSWSEDGIEIFSEGDTYPRPRFHTPAAYLEGFDTALRADGTLEGILKYALDYRADPDYETGYAKKHVQSRELYRSIDEIFGGKEAVGVRIYESPAKYARMNVPVAMEKKPDVQNLFFSPAARLLAACGIPTVWKGEGDAGIAFAENILDVPENVLDKGLILDARAAEILAQRGIDVGVKAFGNRVTCSAEFYRDGYSGVRAKVRCIEPDARATVESTFETAEGRIPAAFRYENAKGQRFFVLCFDGYPSQNELYGSRYRALEIAHAAAWIAGRPVSAFCGGNPGMYILAKQSKDGKKFSVGIWNFFPDPIDEPRLDVAGTFSDIRVISGEAHIENGKPVLAAIPPYGFTGIELTARNS